MQKINSIKNMADTIINSENPIITPDEFETLISISKSQIEKELYIELYNFFLRKKSEDVIKDGKF